MIEPQVIAKLRELEQDATPAPWTDNMQFDVHDMFDNAKLIIASRNALPALLSELETLRELLSELATCNPIQSGQQDSKCIFCHLDWDEGHSADCLITRARQAIK